MKKVMIFAAAILFAAGAQANPENNNSKTSAKGKNSHSKRRSTHDDGKKFNFSIGASLAKSNTKTETFTDANGTATMTRDAAGFGVFAYPKYNVYCTEKYSISVGIPLTLAFSGSSNSRTGSDEGSTSFMYDLPLMVDYNGGVMNPANRFGENRFGYFVGLGIGIQNTTANYTYQSHGYTGEYDSEPKAKSVGPNIHVGGVIRIGSEDRPRFVGLRLAYKIGLNQDKFNYFTPSVFLNF